MSIDPASSPSQPPVLPVAATDPSPILPYATPMQFQPDGVWQDGKLVVAHKGTIYPDVCIKCSAPAHGWRWKRKLSWHHPAWYLLIVFPGLLVYVIVALAIRKSATVSPGLCPAHRRVRRNAILVGWLFVLAGLASVIGGIALSLERAYANSSLPPVLMLGGSVLFIFGAIWGIARSQVVTPSRIEGEYIWLRGAGTPFLAQLSPARPPA